MPLPSSPWGDIAIGEFLEGFFYRPEAFLISAIDQAGDGEITARLDVGHPLLVTPFQTGDPRLHPRHVSGADFVMATACLGSLHAYFLHNLKWQAGWVGFGNRMKNVQFRALAGLDSPVIYQSKEIKARVREEKALFEFEFTFSQDKQVVYQSVQTAMFVKNKFLSTKESSHESQPSSSAHRTGSTRNSLPR